MSASLLIDSGVIIAVERGKLGWDSVITDSDDVAIAAVVVAELLSGVHRANQEYASARAKRINDMLKRFAVEDYDIRVAFSHAELLDHANGRGRMRGAHDLIIAATAAATGRTLVTTDAKADFGSLPGVQVRLIG